MRTSTTFDPYVLAEFRDAGGSRTSGKAMPGRVQELVIYLAGGVPATPIKVRAWIELLTRNQGGVATIHESGVIGLQIGADSWPVLLFQASDRDDPVCRVCGCTQELACDGGCSWATSTLCSRCMARMATEIASDDWEEGPSNETTPPAHP